MPVYYNLSHIVMGLAFVSFGYDKTVLDTGSAELEQQQLDDQTGFKSPAYACFLFHCTTSQPLLL